MTRRRIFRPFWLLIPLLLAAALLAASLRNAAAVVDPPPGARWDDALHQAVRDAGPADPLRFVIYLNEQADLAVLELPAGRTARIAALTTRLQALATSTQQGLLQDLTALREAGAVRTVRPLWIVNAVAVEGNTAALEQISARADVAGVQLDAGRPFPDLDPDAPHLTLADVPSTTWGVAASGAPAAWHGLGISGTGTVVAFMDSGVDWTHPALSANYRGAQNGAVNHDGSWYDAAIPGNAEPFDDIGHGTHVAGTGVGAGGIGVAPGAQWIAVKIANEQGQILDSVVHGAYQWLLAPAGDPARAPQVVNGSWGNPYGANTTFLTDVDVLRAAGIIQVYAAGNGGPFLGSISAPASYPQTIAIGAHDQEGILAWFSSRGASPLTTEFKPLLVAPGTNVLSSLPGNLYSRQLGTSMAAPHVTGAVALLLAADPALDEQAVAALLTSTARPVTSGEPNQDSGWGRLDAYAATAAAAAAAPGSTMSAVALHAMNGGLPIPGVAVTLTTPDGSRLSFATDTRGQLTLPLRAGIYAVSAAAFGYEPSAQLALTLTVGITEVRDLALTRQPFGTVRGQVRRGQSLNGVPAVSVEVDGTPRRAVSDHTGRYQLDLPAGTYTLRSFAAGYRILTRTVTVAAGAAAVLDFTVEPAPRVLFVDGGRYLFGETGDYFTTALRDAGLGFDTRLLVNPYLDNPPAAVLADYDTVVWSSPFYSPEVVDEPYAVVLYDYLEAGGQLLISGEDVGRRVGTGFPPSAWWLQQLGARFVRSARPPFALSGAPNTPYAGLTLGLNGGDSAANQFAPDIVAPRVGYLAEPLLTYADGGIGALRSGLCAPYDIVYLGFGLEGVDQRETRAALIEGAFDYFTAPPQPAGVRVARLPIDDFVLPGTLYTATLPIFNYSEVATETFSLSVSGDVWPTTLTTTTLTLGPCNSGPTDLHISVPARVGDAGDQIATVTVRARSDPALLATYTVALRTPQKPVLLVDDDRFYNAEAAYEAALDALDVEYDRWDIGWDNDVRGSPSAAFLSAYDVVLWYTGYDFFQPLTPAEASTAAAYVRQGGRLFLSSQDFLYYHEHSDLTRSFLGIRAYTESLSTTLAIGSGPLAGLQTPLTFGTYQNNADGLFPADPAAVQLWGDRGLPVGLQMGRDEWRTVFWAIPLETMPLEARTAALGGVLRQLTDLGGTRWEVDRQTGLSEPRVYTLTLHNSNEALPRTVAITNGLPISLTLEPMSLSGADYDPETRQVTWSGVVAPGAAHVVSYRAAPASGLPAGTPLFNRVAVADEAYGWVTPLAATTWIGVPNLSRSSVAVSVPALRPPDGAFTATVRLHNEGPVDGTGISATLALPDPLSPVSGTLFSSAGTITLGKTGARWLGDIPAGSTVTITLGITVSLNLDLEFIPITTYIEVTSTPVLRRTAWIPILVPRLLFPAIDYAR